MYEIKKLFVIVDGNYINMSQRFAGILCTSYDEVHEVMKLKEFHIICSQWFLSKRRRIDGNFVLDFCNLLGCLRDWVDYRNSAAR